MGSNNLRSVGLTDSERQEEPETAAKGLRVKVPRTAPAHAKPDDHDPRGRMKAEAWAGEDKAVIDSSEQEKLGTACEAADSEPRCDQPSPATGCGCGRKGLVIAPVQDCTVTIQPLDGQRRTVAQLLQVLDGAKRLLELMPDCDDSSVGE